MNSFEVSPIGYIETPFGQKLGVPRQPNLCPSVKAKIILEPAFRREDTLRGLESFSHLWVLYQFNQSESWRETIKPPRLGGKEKVGVFASRAPHRPNQIGFSVVSLESIDKDLVIHVCGVDILDRTPIIDIKPYLPLWDSIPEANNGWVDQTPKLEALPVDFSLVEKETMKALTSQQEALLRETLCWDPRPAYTKDDSRSFIHSVGDIEVTWKRMPDCISVLKIKLS